MGLTLFSEIVVVTTKPAWLPAPIPPPPIELFNPKSFITFFPTANLSSSLSKKNTEPVPSTVSTSKRIPTSWSSNALLPEPIIMNLSSTSRLVTFIVVVSPWTVKFPPITTLFVILTGVSILVISVWLPLTINEPVIWAIPSNGNPAPVPPWLPVKKNSPDSESYNTVFKLGEFGCSDKDANNFPLELMWPEAVMFLNVTSSVLVNWSELLITSLKIPSKKEALTIEAVIFLNSTSSVLVNWSELLITLWKIPIKLEAEIKPLALILEAVILDALIVVDIILPTVISGVPVKPVASPVTVPTNVPKNWLAVILPDAVIWWVITLVLALIDDAVIWLIIRSPLELILPEAVILPDILIPSWSIFNNPSNVAES